MAKSSKAAYTRIATTVTARYYPTSGATDGFYLDGRLSGRREQRAADITLDREERGFFYAVYAHLTGNAQDEGAASQVKKALDKIMNEVKEPSHNIDAEINELAECAVSVAGRIALKHDGMRQPYFSGILVRDSEMAAVTMGNGCAYLYRGDVLYPLTADEYPLEAIDYAGKPVNGLDIYCAGVAGTVRYSNIAQLQMDDCLIVCNRDIMEALGQREVLRMLYEAEDQADAAGMIITAAAAKLPGTPMQFMIGFVENITSADRTTRIGMARGHGDTAAGASLSAAALSSIGRGKPPAGRTAAEPDSDEGAPDLIYTPARDKAQARRSGSMERTQPVAAQKAVSGRGTDRDAGRQADPFDEEEDVFGDEIDTYGRGRRIAFYVIIAAVCIGCLVLIYNMLFNRRGQDPDQTTTTTTVSTTTLAPTSSTTTESSQPSETETTTTESAPTTTTTNTSEILAEHTVVAGDTPWGIAQKYYGRASFERIRLIMEANGVEGDPEDFTIKVGDVLIIPAE